MGKADKLGGWLFRPAIVIQKEEAKEDKNMEWLFNEVNEQLGAGEVQCPLREWMGTKIKFRSGDIAKAFDSLRNESKDRIAAYVKSGFSPMIAAELLGVSSKSFGKSMGKVIRRLGASSTRECFADYKKKGVDSSTASELKRLLIQQEYRCALSGVPLEPSRAEIDHIKPVSKGGGHGINNLQWLSKHVNRAKGTMSNDAFIEMCKQVVKWNQ